MTTTKPYPRLSRRRLLACASTVLAFPRFAFAALPEGRKLVVILLRGGMDGLAAVIPAADRDHARLRKDLATSDGLLDLDGFFALPPELSDLLPLWKSNHLSVVHACASPYRNRSHFEAQNVLEGGGTRPYAHADGWLNRALASLAAQSGQALAVSDTLPLLLRGSAPATSWAPSPLPGLASARIQALAALYRSDGLLHAALEEGVQMQDFVNANLTDMPSAASKSGVQFPELAALAGKAMAVSDGPSVGVLELGGWDTHANQPQRIAKPLSNLGQGVARLRDTLGGSWRNTVVLAVSEFGRTVSMNGTDGTDHGTAGAVLLAGGAVNGGRVIVDWPGLDQRSLLEGRDLRPTTDVRAVLKAVLREHLGLDPGLMQSQVFPDSADVRPLSRLIR